ncbi:DUF805 domain-containing protein [Arthrobacter sp. H14-L1]|uniref:DUF805 domain-containing protein n=1 Tax=Arthrobacter sp. H14-L1 TaxID=2996697 RepID=UPI002271E932|nr:DUF805 domain-containing protein [Arthrobacter sp. H14-L1]MCY0904590.1 DUF805 domain-containing protein [Arthrobacter sp. H14-L1]
MGLDRAVSKTWRQNIVFSGRASRSEYWWWALVSAVIVLVLEIIGAIAGGAGATVAADGTSIPGPGFGVVAAIIGLWGLATIIPGLALLSSRLHDGNFSAWFILLGLVPFVGAIALWVMALMPSSPQGQRFDGPEAVQQGSGYNALRLPPTAKRP